MTDFSRDPVHNAIQEGIKEDNRRGQSWLTEHQRDDEDVDTDD